MDAATNGDLGSLDAGDGQTGVHAEGPRDCPGTHLPSAQSKIDHVAFCESRGREAKQQARGKTRGSRISKRSLLRPWKFPQRDIPNDLDALGAIANQSVNGHQYQQKLNQNISWGTDSTFIYEPGSTGEGIKQRCPNHIRSKT